MDSKRLNVRQILDFLYVTARLKSEVRHSWNVSGTRAESVAEHCFQMVLFAYAVSRYLDNKVDAEHLIKLCICHDLAEAIVGDTPYIEGSDRELKHKLEEQGIVELIKDLPVELALEIKQLWEEFENGETLEAKCAKALDNLEAQMQHNIAPLNSWEEREFSYVFTKMDKWCAHDETLVKLCEAIKDDACTKMRSEGVAPEKYAPKHRV